jgi:D-alanyl-D-alanine carboxypeptidase/D-alanyl-D-alanine-endopeptidase (penicillin-binding protein 4)
MPLTRTLVSRLALVLALALVAASCSDDGSDSSDSAGSDLPEDATEIMDGEAYETAHWTLQVTSIDGDEVLYEQDPGKISFMASNTKLYTVGTWLDVFGPDHTIETPVYGLGPLDGGTLDGDLMLRAMGDLVMGGREAGSGELGYSIPPQGDANGLPGAQPAPGDPLTGLDDLAEQVAASGVTEVGGDVVIDDRLFEQWTTPRPLEISPIVINDNLLAVVTTPGSEGDAPTIETIPDTDAFEVVVDAETVAVGEDTQLAVEPELGPDGEPTNTLVLAGQIAEDSDPLLNVYDVVDPASYARTLFIEALERAGVTVTADPLADNDTADVPEAAEYTEDDEALATLESPPLSELATLIFKISHNYGADLTICLLAVEQGSTDCDDGFAPVRERIADLDIPPGDVWLLDGSGSSAAATTPRAMTAWLRWLDGLEWGDQLPEMLPILGLEGSLSLAQTESPSVGLVQAKTGTWGLGDPSTGRLLMLDQSLAGFMESDDGERYAFAIYMNGTTFDDPSAILGVLDDVAGVSAAVQQSLP